MSDLWEQCPAQLMSWNLIHMQLKIHFQLHTSVSFWVSPLSRYTCELVLQVHVYLPAMVQNMKIFIKEQKKSVSLYYSCVNAEWSSQKLERAASLLSEVQWLVHAISFMPISNVLHRAFINFTCQKFLHLCMLRAMCIEFFSSCISFHIIFIFVTFKQYCEV